MTKIISILFAGIFALASTANAAVLNFAGFESGTESEAWDPGGSGSTVSNTYAKTGTYSLNTSASGAGTASYEIGCLGSDGQVARCNLSTAYFRIAFRVETGAASGDEVILNFMRSADGLSKGFVTRDSSGKLKLFDSTGSQCGSTGSTTVSTGSWYRIEGKIPNGTSAAAEIKLDGNLEISGTCNFLANNFGLLVLGKSSNRNSNTVDYYYDDYKIDDAAYPGDGGVTRLAPTSNGSTANWTGGTNSSNYLEVDEVPTDGDTTYIAKSASSSQTHLVNVTDTGAAGISGTVNAVREYARCRSSAGTAATSVRLSSSGTTADTTARAIGTSYEDLFLLRTTDPNTSAAWTTGGVDALQAGIIDSAAISTVRCTTIFVDVDWTAGGSGGDAILLLEG